MGVQIQSKIDVTLHLQRRRPSASRSQGLGQPWALQRRSTNRRQGHTSTFPQIREEHDLDHARSESDGPSQSRRQGKPRLGLVGSLRWRGEGAVEDVRCDCCEESHATHARRKRTGSHVGLSTGTCISRRIFPGGWVDEKEYYRTGTSDLGKRGRRLQVHRRSTVTRPRLRAWGSRARRRLLCVREPVGVV